MVGFHLLLGAFALVQIARYGRGAVLFARSLTPAHRELRRGNGLAFTITLVSVLILATAIYRVLWPPGQ
jgi:hypothetical protein